MVMKHWKAIVQKLTKCTFGQTQMEVIAMIALLTRAFFFHMNARIYQKLAYPLMTKNIKLQKFSKTHSVPYHIINKENGE